MAAPKSAFRRLLLALVLLYFSWLAMLTFHELGHILSALLSRGKIISLSIPLLGFSQTIVHPNPHERFVVWGGPLGGSIFPFLPMAVLLLLKKRIPNLLRFFAGFCLIANGSYIGLGPLFRSGDAADLLRLGVPPTILILFGTITAPAGLWLWHSIPAMTFRHQRSSPQVGISSDSQ